MLFTSDKNPQYSSNASTLESRFVSNSHCNLIFLDFFEDHVMNLKKKYLIELITFCEFIRYVEHFLLPSFLVVLVPNWFHTSL